MDWPVWKRRNSGAGVPRPTGPRRRIVMATCAALGLAALSGCTSTGVAVAKAGLGLGKAVADPLRKDDVIEGCRAAAAVGKG